MNFFFIISAFILLTFGCGSKKTNFASVQEVMLEISDPQNCLLDEIATDVFCCNLNLPDDYFFGDIIDIKEMGDSLLFFHDYYNKQIHVFTKNGILINVLNKQGRGPGEYVDIEFFAINTFKSELLVYDHSGRQFVFYTIPELTYIKKIPVRHSLMASAFISPNKLLLISDDDKEKTSTQTTCVGAGCYDLETKRFDGYELDNLMFSICLSYPRTISCIGENCYYAYPDKNSVVYKVTAEKGLEPLVRFSFGSKNGNSEFWKCNDLGKCNEIIVEQDVALMPHFFNFSDEFYSFYFIYRDLKYPYFALSDRKGNESRVYKEIKIRGIEVPHLMPVGIMKNSYMFLIYPHECTFDEEEIQKSPISRLIAEKIKLSPDEGTPVLLMFKPKL